MRINCDESFGPVSWKSSLWYKINNINTLFKRNNKDNQQWSGRHKLKIIEIKLAMLQD